MSEDRCIYILAHALARKRAAQAVAEAPEGWRVTVEPPRRNGDQNALLHALIGEIAERCEWAGRRWCAETWKRLLVASWDRATKQTVLMVPALDGQGFDVVFRRTSTLTKRECAELIEFIQAWMAERPEFAEVEHV